jgi:hypothetical protein
METFVRKLVITDRKISKKLKHFASNREKKISCYLMESNGNRHQTDKLLGLTVRLFVCDLLTAFCAWAWL